MTSNQVPTWQELTDSLAARRMADEAAAVAAVAEHDTLTQALAQAQAAVTPPTLYGSSAWLNTDERWTTGTVWNRLDRAMGPLRVCSVYDGAQGLLHAIDVALAAQRGNPNLPVFVRWKDYNWTGFVSGSSRAYYLQQFARLTPGMILAPYHEYDRKVLKTHEYNYNDVHFAWDQLRIWARLAGVPNRWAAIVTGYNLTDTGAPLIIDADIIGIDPYPLSGQTVLDCVGPMLDTIKQHTNLPVAVCEIGRWATVQDSTLVAQLGSLRGKVSHVCWFNAPGTGPGGTVDYRIDNTSSAVVYQALTA